MPFHLRPRRLAQAALTVALGAVVAACAQHPNTIFHQRTDFNREVDSLFKLLIWLGVAVFVVVEGILIVALVRFRRRAGQPEPEHTHGNTAMEIAWTIIPAIVLLVIAVPTVRTIFVTQAPARADALQVEVWGHQWWWEFRYPQYTQNGGKDTLVTANELYLPIGRTVNFTLQTKDVLHSFWIPGLGGKRDLIANHVNHLWFTPDSVNAFNGFCAEYCGENHGNMRFKVFTVSQDDFTSWTAHQLQPSMMEAPVAPPATGPGVGTKVAATKTPATAPPTTPILQAGFMQFPMDKIPDYAKPKTPLPAQLKFDDNVLAAGNAANGEKLVSTGMCIACHTIRGEKSMIGEIGPNLTHLASRTTIAGAIYPNDAEHLARWVKNASAMKPGVTMPTFGLGEYDPVSQHGIVKFGGFTDQQIADIVAYLRTLK